MNTVCSPRSGVWCVLLIVAIASSAVLRAQGSAGRIEGTVRDEQSPVQRVEYSLDASRWRMVYPKDGIPDSRREEFEVAVDDTEAGRSVIIRATDAMNNVATAVASLQR